MEKENSFKSGVFKRMLDEDKDRDTLCDFQGGNKSLTPNLIGQVGPLLLGGEKKKKKKKKDSLYCSSITFLKLFSQCSHCFQFLYEINF